MKKGFSTIMVPLLLILATACANTRSVIRVHPVEIRGLVDCTGCHTHTWSQFNHTSASFYQNHRYYGGESRFVCNSCHQESFCADCHAHKEEIKPSDKHPLAVERNLPHRGDYIGQHRIDGRVNPALCLKCHGRSNNEGCKRCHR